MDHNASQLGYQKPATSMTLAEGLAEYYAQIPGLTDPTILPPAEAEFFQAHDVSHVVFGCDTSPAQEMLIGAWTWYGTTASIRDIVRYSQSQEVSRMRREIGYLHGMRLFFRELPRMWRVVRCTRQMTRRWPLLGYDAYLARPLREIRAEFNIGLV